MAFKVPNLADAAFTPQAGLDSVDLSVITAANSLTGVLSGAEVTAQGTPDSTVAVSAGFVRINGRKVTVAAGNLTMTAADGVNPRIDLVTVNQSGTKAWTAGVAATSPAMPLVPIASVALAAVYVPASDNVVNEPQITDKRIFIDDPTYENVLWFGADPTGVTDSTQAFADALAALPSAAPNTGGLIRIPNGQYLLNGTGLTVPGSGTATPAAGGSLTAGTYFYRVTAFNAAGETQGNAEFSGTTAAANLILNLSWAASTGPALKGYKVYRHTATGGNWKLVGWTGTNSFADNGTTAGSALGAGPQHFGTPVGLNPVTSLNATPSTSGGVLVATGYTYAYGVTAYNDYGETTIVSGTTTIASGTTGSIALTWTAPANSSAVIGYRIYFGRQGANSEGYWAETATNSYTITGQLPGPNGNFTLGMGTGKAPKYNTSGMYVAYPTPAGNSVIGWHFPSNRYAVRVEGESGVMGNITGSVGTTLVPGTTDMSVLVIGDGLALNQVGPNFAYINIADILPVTGVMGVTVAATNKCSFQNVSDKYLDVAYRWGKFHELDCAWHQCREVVSYQCNRWAMHFGTSFGGQLIGGDMNLGNNAGGIHLGYSQSWKLLGTFFDGAVVTINSLMHANSCAVRAQARPGGALYGHNHIPEGTIGGGGSGCGFSDVKLESCAIDFDLDASGNFGQGRGHHISSITSVGNEGNEIGLYARSVNVNRLAVMGYNCHKANPVQDNGDRNNIIGQVDIMTPGSAEEFQVGGHLAVRPMVGAATTAAAGANAGGSPPAPVLSDANDMRGRITFGTGTGATAGAMVAVTFGRAFRRSTPRIVVCAANAATAALRPYVSGEATTGFTFSVDATPASSQANTVYAFSYQVIG
jgi:hypothetical protein